MTQPRFRTFMVRNGYTPEDFSQQIQDHYQKYLRILQRVEAMDPVEQRRDLDQAKPRLRQWAHDLFQAMVAEKQHELDNNPLVTANAQRVIPTAKERDIALLETLVKKGQTQGLFRSFLLGLGLSFDPKRQRGPVGPYRLEPEAGFYHRYSIRSIAHSR